MWILISCKNLKTIDLLTGVAAALRNEVEELRKVEAEVEHLRKRRDEGKV